MHKSLLPAGKQKSLLARATGAGQKTKVLLAGLAKTTAVAHTASHDFPISNTTASKAKDIAKEPLFHPSRSR